MFELLKVNVDRSSFCHRRFAKMDVQSKIYSPCCSGSLLTMSAFISDLPGSSSSDVFSWDNNRMFRPQLFKVGSLYLNNVFLITLISHVNVTLFSRPVVPHQLSNWAVCNLNVVIKYFDFKIFGDDKNILKTYLSGFQVLAFLKKIKQKSRLRSDWKIPEDCQKEFRLFVLGQIINYWQRLCKVGLVLFFLINLRFFSFGKVVWSPLTDSLKLFFFKWTKMLKETYLEGVVEEVACNWVEAYGLLEKSDPLIDLSVVLGMVQETLAFWPSQRCL